MQHQMEDTSKNKSDLNIFQPSFLIAGFCQ